VARGIAVMMLIIGVSSSLDAILHYLISLGIIPGNAGNHSQGLLGIPFACFGIGLLVRREWALDWSSVTFGCFALLFGLGAIVGIFTLQWIMAAACSLIAAILYLGCRFLCDDRTRRALRVFKTA